MYNDYKDGNPDKSVSYKFYRNRVCKMKISFTKLGNEQCEICDQVKLFGDTSIEACDIEEHEIRYQTAHQEYQKYVQLYSHQSVDSTSTICVSVDMEKVILLPHIPCYKAAIFANKLIAFNKTFVPVGETNEPIFACSWLEEISKRNKEDLISTFFAFMMRYKHVDQIIIWLDNCAAQNKNWSLMSFLVFIITSDLIKAKEIDLKYFEVNHGYMSANSFHHQAQHAKEGSVIRLL